MILYQGTTTKDDLNELISKTFPVLCFNYLAKNLFLIHPSHPLFPSPPLPSFSHPSPLHSSLFYSLLSLPECDELWALPEIDQVSQLHDASYSVTNWLQHRLRLAKEPQPSLNSSSSRSDCKLGIQSKPISFEIRIKQATP